MKAPAFVINSLTLLFVAWLSGCSTAALAPTGAASSPSVRGATNPEPDVTRSSGEALLYVATSLGTVYTYSYPKGKPMGSLSGLDHPAGECVDLAGDVFITTGDISSSTASTIYEYAHNGSSPIATLSDPGYAFGCSIDPLTGDLAVSNVYDKSNPYNSENGSVAIYSEAQGTPTMYYSPDFDVFFCGYDKKGDLYLTVSNGQPHEAQLARLDKGSSSLTALSLNTTLYGSTDFVPSVQWDGKHITVSSNKGFGNPVSIYRLAISGRKASVVGTTTLQSEKDHHGGAIWIDGKRIIGVVYIKGAGDVATWPYPSGGQPSRMISHIIGRNEGVLSGLTVSRTLPRN